MVERSPGSSEAEVLTTENQVSRKAVALPDREMADIIVEETEPSRARSDGQPSAEDAVKAAQRAAAEATDRANREATARQAAERRATTAETQARASATADRTGAIKDRLDAAKGKVDAAKSQLRAARDGNDYDAEERALEAMADAKAEEKLLGRELEFLQGQKERAAPARDGTGTAADGGGRQPTGDEPTGEEIAWVQSHPMFNSDPAYQAAVRGAATEAVNRGMARGSLAFLDFVNQQMSARFGEGHGVEGTHGRRTARGRANQEGGDDLGRRPLSMAMPRSGAGGGSGDYEEIGGAGTRYMDTEFGKVTIETGPGGQPRIRMPPRVHEMWKEAASWMKHADGKPFTLAEYAQEQVAAAEEERAGLDNGLRYQSDRVYR